MHRHHGYALITITTALILDFVLGWAYGGLEGIPHAHGLYCALANAVTVGCDVAPRRTAGYVINTVEFLTIVPLFAATLSLFTSGLASVHPAEAIRQHVARKPPAGPTSV